MTRKHFELIASAMALQAGTLGHKEACIALCDALATSNRLFNSKRFLVACGVIL